MQTIAIAVYWGQWTAKLSLLKQSVQQLNIRNELGICQVSDKFGIGNLDFARVDQEVLSNGSFVATP